MNENTVTYQVNVKVQKEISEKYYLWLTNHIKEIMTINGFLSANLSKLEDSSDINTESYCVNYILESREKLENYFINFAPKMRQEGIDRFGNKFSAERKIMKNIIFFKN